MDRAWDLFRKINTKRDVYTNTVNPDQWMENAEAYHREWDAYKQKIPPIMRALLFMNPFAYYMEYCDRMVTNSTKELRLPLGEGRDAVIYENDYSSDDQ